MTPVLTPYSHTHGVTKGVCVCFWVFLPTWMFPATLYQRPYFLQVSIHIYYHKLCEKRKGAEQTKPRKQLKRKWEKLMGLE